MNVSPAAPSIVHLAAHRRRMAMKGQMHLERIAAVAAGAKYEPLPKRRPAKKRIA